MQGEGDPVVDALAKGDRQSAPLDEAHQRLMEFVERLTRHAYRTCREHVQELRDVGWSDAQIAEAVYVTAMFALFNRVADAFGLADPQYRQGGEGPRPAERFGE